MRAATPHFQAALAQVSGTKLALDGDLVHPGQSQAGETEAAARSLSRELGLDNSRIRHDLEQGKGRDFEQTPLYRKVFELADRPQRQARAHGCRPGDRSTERQDHSPPHHGMVRRPRRCAPPAVSCAAREGRISRISWRLENDARSNS
jgi:hypothetical protein